MPFASVLTAEKIARIFRKHGGWFGENRIYNTAVVLWAFLRQDAPTEDTSDYCQARAKLSEPAIRELSTEIANDAEQTCYGTWVPGDDRGWSKWHKGESVPQPLLADWCREQMTEAPVYLDEKQRSVPV